MKGVLQKMASRRASASSRASCPLDRQGPEERREPQLRHPQEPGESTGRAEQRRIIYTLRQRVLDGEDMKGNVMEMVERRNPAR